MKYSPYLVPVSVKGIVIEEGGIWLRKNERNEWELPGGKIDQGEQPQETVARELAEEMGFTISVGDLIDATMYKIQRSLDESIGVLVICYLCTVTHRTGVYELEGEAGKSEFKFFKLNEVQGLTMPDFYKRAIQKASTLI